MPRLGFLIRFLNKKRTLRESRYKTDMELTILEKSNDCSAIIFIAISEEFVPEQQVYKFQ